MMNRILVWMAIIVIGAGLIACFITREKTGFIDIHEVYQKFDLKKELERKFKTVQEQRKIITDSMELNLKLLENKLRTVKSISDAEAADFQSRRQDYLQINNRFEEDNQQLTAQYDKEILKQLNQYVHDYGIEKGYDYIFGNDNNGAFMHADKKLEITEDVIRYINDKYKGIK